MSDKKIIAYQDEVDKIWERILNVDNIRSIKDVRAIIANGKARELLNIGDTTTVYRAKTLTPSASSGLTATISDEGKFTKSTGKSGNITFTFSFGDGNWHYGTEVIDLADFGITLTGTPSSGAYINVAETAEPIEYVLRSFLEKFDDGKTWIVWKDGTKKYESNVKLAEGKKYGAIFEVKTLPVSLQFDAAEMLYVVTEENWPSGLPAGKHYLKGDHSTYGAGTTEDGTYEINTTQVIPVGGGIKHSNIGQWRSAYSKETVLSGKWTTYNADGTTIESNLACTEWESGGNNLGTFSARQNYVSDLDALNCSERNGYGSNNVADSAILQYLQSDEYRVSWEKKTVFDIKPSWDGSQSGYMFKLDGEFLDCVQDSEIEVALPPTWEGQGTVKSETITSKFFLPTKANFYAGSATAAGEKACPWEFYEKFSGLTTPGTGADNNRIKKNTSGTATYYWSFSPYSGVGYGVWTGYPDGHLGNSSASGSLGVPVACVIS